MRPYLIQLPVRQHLVQLVTLKNASTPPAKKTFLYITNSIGARNPTIFHDNNQQRFLFWNLRRWVGHSRPTPPRKTPSSSALLGCEDVSCRPFSEADSNRVPTIGGGWESDRGLALKWLLDDPRQVDLVESTSLRVWGLRFEVQGLRFGVWSVGRWTRVRFCMSLLRTCVRA